MKTSSSFGRIAFLALALGTASATAILAQSTTPDPAAPPAKHGLGGAGGRGGWGANALTDAEKAQLQKAHDAALAADPALQAESDKLKASRASLKDATPEARKTAMDDAKAFQDKLKAAELKIDPTLQPIFDKLDKARAGFKGGKRGGAGGGAPAAPAPAGA